MSDMRVLFVVQRYGREVFGGAEAFCREYATRLAASEALDVDVEVLTSRAVSYVDWRDSYEGGIQEIDGVTVHRLPVVAPRDNDLFNGLNNRLNAGHRPSPLFLQREWMRQQGPRLEGFVEWIDANVARFDVAVFVGYLYWTTWAGLPAASAQVPTVLHPTAHDEPPIYLPLFDPVFRHPSAFGFLTPEEAALVVRRFRVRRPSTICGVGVDLDIRGDASRFRSAYGLGDDPFLLFVGRLDPHKGSDELYDYFVAYKERNPGPLRLVLVGEPIKPVPPHPDVLVTGFVDDTTWADSYAAATAFVHPSYFESFSMVLQEAWVQRVPALVQGRCEVLRGHAERSGGGIPYRGYAEFEAAVELLLGDAELRDRMGSAGRAYVESHYGWDELLARYERFLDDVCAVRRVLAP